MLWSYAVNCDKNCVMCCDPSNIHFSFYVQHNFEIKNIISLSLSLSLSIYIYICVCVCVCVCVFIKNQSSKKIQLDSQFYATHLI